MARNDSRPIELLARRAGAGSLRAAESIVRDRLPHIRRLIRHVVGSVEELDDMTQIAMITVLQGIPTFRGEGDFVAWVDRVVVRSAFAYVKHRRTQLRHIQGALEDASGAESREARPDAVLDRMRTLALLDRLSDEQHQAVVMHHVMQLTVPEIADELAIPAETVRTRLRTGLSKLRAILGSRP